MKRMGRTRKKPHRILRWIGGFLLGGFLVGLVLMAVGWFFYLRPEYERLKKIAYDKLASGNVEDLTRLSDTVIYDTNGEILGIVNAGHYVYVKIDQISENLQHAYIAQEDRKFMKHHGVDYMGTLRALIQLIRHRGRITQGGSTITQQLVKNTYLSSEKVYTRKIVEMMLAQELEKRYSKNEIMELYCNTNFYGNNCYGVESASLYYFNKSAADLTIPEAAMLAGVSNAPSRYEPLKHPDACLAKRNRVLNSLSVCGYITAEECEQYKAMDLGVSRNIQRETDEDYLTSYALYSATLTLMDLNEFHFEYLWENEAEQKAYEEKYNESYDFYNKEIRRGGYQIYTALNPEIQRIVQEKLDKDLEKFKDLQENGKFSMQGAAAVVDNESGYVVAAVGGRGTEDKYNRAYLSVRQPGSSIKPLLDYTPALDSGRYSPGSLIDDHKFENGPSNSGDHYYGQVTLREAVNRSLNTVAWQVLSDIGVDYGLDYLKSMHFQGLSWVDNTSAAVSIGGFTNGTKIVDMAKGYATLANGGRFSERSCIQKIVHQKNGEITKNYHPGDVQIYREDSSYMMTDILKGTITKPYGTGRGLALDKSMPCAGKTGTSNASKDTWFCGYTRYYTMAVWVGHDLPAPMPGIYGATYAGKIWRDAMNVLHKDLPAKDWDKPSTVETQTDKKTGIEDLVSTTAEVRAAASLRKKTEKEKKAEAEELLTKYESMIISRVEDIFTERELYQQIKSDADIVSDAESRRKIFSRLSERKKYFDKIEDSMREEIQSYEESSEEESRVQSSIAASRAEESRIARERERRLAEIRALIQKLEEAEYQDKDTDAMLLTAQKILADYKPRDGEEDLTEELENAIERVKKLPRRPDENGQGQLNPESASTDGQQSGPGVIGPGDPNLMKHPSAGAVVGGSDDSAPNGGRSRVIGGR